MITRLVKMHFNKADVVSFCTLFDIAKPKIEAMPGCLKVTLHRDTKQPDIFFTISYWKSEQDLEHYRNSALFIDTWKKVKPLFKERAEAWSLN